MNGGTSAGLERKNKQARKNNRIIRFEGKDYIMKQLAREQGIDYHVLMKYLDECNSAEEAVLMGKKWMWLREVRKQRKS